MALSGRRPARGNSQWLPPCWLLITCPARPWTCGLADPSGYDRTVSTSSFPGRTASAPRPIPVDGATAPGAARQPASPKKILNSKSNKRRPSRPHLPGDALLHPFNALTICDKYTISFFIRAALPSSSIVSGNNTLRRRFCVPPFCHRYLAHHQSSGKRCRRNGPGGCGQDEKRQERTRPPLADMSA